MGHVFNWTNNDVGDGENGIIGRDDSLLLIINYLSGMDRSSRDNGEMSTMGATRSGMTILYNNIPLINVEENENVISDAFYDLVETFQWLPHNGQLPFVCGIAMTKSAFQVYLMTADAAWKSSAPTENASISNSDDRAMCLLYAVNIARGLKFFIESGRIYPSELQFGVLINGSSKMIRLSSPFVENSCCQQNESKYQSMKTLYTTLSYHGIPHIELPTGKEPYDDMKKIIRLGPVGIQGKPRSTEEVQITFRHMMRCMRALHKKAEYLHCDLRWPNVIVAGTKWYVIDCTRVCPSTPVRKNVLSCRRR